MTAEEPRQKRREKILCPECGLVQVAGVEETTVYPIYLHQCDGCDHWISESEWETVP